MDVGPYATPMDTGDGGNRLNLPSMFVTVAIHEQSMIHFSERTLTVRGFVIWSAIVALTIANQQGMCYVQIYNLNSSFMIYLKKKLYQVIQFR